MIEIIATGKIPSEYRILIDDFIKKTSIYQKISLIELKEIKLKSDESNLAQKIKDETNIALERAKGDIVILDADGDMPTTDEFTELVKKYENIGGTISFIIGGSYGFDHSLIKKYKKISLSKLTLLHHMATLVLVEAIYRAHKIIRGAKYDK